MTTATVPSLSAAIAAVNSHLGFREGPGNRNPWTERLGLGDTFYCAAGVTCVLRDAGVNVKVTASCPDLRTWAMATGRWTRTPTLGSIVIYGADAHHCGYVTSVSGSSFTTTEFNTAGPGAGINADGDGVYVKARSMSPGVAGFVRLDYAGTGTIPAQRATPTPAAATAAGTAAAKGATKKVTIKKGQTLGGIAAAAGISLAVLLGLNPSLAAHPDRIFAGDSVTVPAAAPSLAAVPAPSAPAAPAPAQTPTSTPQATTGPRLVVLGRYLGTWSRGTDVEALQRELAARGLYSGGDVSGLFLTKTREAVIRQQRLAGLTPDGVVGAATARSLGWRWSGTGPNQ